MAGGWRRHDHRGRQAPAGHRNAYGDDTGRIASYSSKSVSNYIVKTTRPAGTQHGSRPVFPSSSRTRSNIPGSKPFTTSGVTAPIAHGFNPLSSSKTPWLTSHTRSKRPAQTMVPAMSTAQSTLVPRPRTPPTGHFYEKNGVLYALTSDPGLNSSDPMNLDGPSPPPVTHREVQKYPPRRQLASKAALSNRASATYYDSDTSDEGGSNSEPEDNSKEIIIISSESESSDTPADRDLPSLLAALGPLAVPALLHLHGALPFLARNLRQCFIERCRQEGIPTFPRTAPEHSLRVTYRFRVDDECDWNECYGSRTEWRCPFCDFHGAFNTREMLAYHLDRDHCEVQKVWTQLGRGRETQWLLLVQWTSSHVTPLKAITLKSQVEQAAVVTSVVDNDENSLRVDSESNLSIQLGNVSINPVNARAAEDMPRLKCEEESGDAISFIPPSCSPEPQPDIFTQESVTGKLKLIPLRRGITEDGRLVPPPKEARWGPAGGPHLESCRPGGPRLFDFLNELSLEPFGVMSWAIVEREDEIFEHDDLCDEDKVMLALWNRWIALNREAFVFGDRYAQVLKFLDEYYKMIHRAAGWNALRQFLLLLLANKFLTIAHVSKTMEHYEKLVDMSSWYEDDKDNQE